MKRRNFLKGLSILPIGIGAFRKKVKEELKPEPPKVVEPKPVNLLKRSLGPQSGQNVTCWSTTWTIDGWKMDG